MLMPPSSHQTKESMQALSSKPTFALFRPHSLLRGAHDSYTICRDRGVTGSNPARPTTTNTQKQRFKFSRPHQLTHTHIFSNDERRRFKFGRPHHATHTHN